MLNKIVKMTLKSYALPMKNKTVIDVLIIALLSNLLLFIVKYYISESQNHKQRIFDACKNV